LQHKNLLKHAKGYRGRSKNCYTIAIRRVEKAWQYAYRDRRRKKREWRKLWIMKTQAGCRQYGYRYSAFVPALAQANITLNRKVLAELAANEPFAFKAIVDVLEHHHQQQQSQLDDTRLDWKQDEAA
jgi:large subunit ribosomal protein L20